MANTSKSSVIPKAAQDDTLPNTLVLGVDESYDLALRFWRGAKYGAARACVWPFTRPKLARSVNVVVGMTNMLAVIDWSEREYARAARTLATVAPLVDTLSDRFLQGKYFNSCALCEKAKGRHEQAFAFYRDALHCYTLAGATRYAGEVEANIGNLLIHTGHPKAADPYITRAVQSCDEPLTLAQILDTRAKQELAFGHFDEARQLVSEAIGILCGLSGVDTYLAASARTLHDIDAAEAASMNQSFAGVILR